MTYPVYLVRHGEVHNPDHIVYADLPGFGLSETGRWQATLVANHLAAGQLAAVVASPLQRAVETATAIAARHGLTVETDPNLTEWRLLQRWKGLGWDSLDSVRPGELAAYLDTPTELPWSEESLESLARRMVRVVTDVSARASGPVAFVGHQDPIQACRLVLTRRALGALNVDKPAHAEVFTLEPGAPWREVDRWAPPQARSGHD